MRLREFLYPDVVFKLSEPLQMYSQKLHKYMIGLYLFFLVVALITYQIVKLYGISYFYIALAVAVCVGLIFEQLYDLMAVYQVKPTLRSIIVVFLFAILFSVLCSGFVFFLMQVIGLSGKVATIAGLIVLKLLQPPACCSLEKQ